MRQFDWTLRSRRGTGIILIAGVLLAAAVAWPVAAAAKAPYTVVVSPNKVTAGSSGNTLRFKFSTTGRSGGSVSIKVPVVAGGSRWTAPQKSHPRRAGYVRVTKGTCRSASISSITKKAGGPWIIHVKARCGRHRSFSVWYGRRGSVRAASLAGQYVFKTTHVASQPVVTVLPGAAAAIVLGGTADGTAAAGSNRTVSVTPVDKHGNTATGYRGTVQFAGDGPASCWTLPHDHTFDGSEFMFGGTIAMKYGVTCAGERTLTATDSATPRIKGSRTFTINSGPTHSVAVTNMSIGGTAIPGQAVVVRMDVFARDAFDNVVTNDNGPVTLSVGGFGYEAIGPFPTEVTLVNGVAGVSIDAYALAAHEQVSADASRPGIIGTGSILDINPIPPDTAAARFSATPSGDGLNYDAHLLLRAPGTDPATPKATVTPVVTPTTICATNADGTCTLLFDGQLSTGSPISGSLTLTSAMNVITHEPADSTIEVGQPIAIGGCLNYSTNDEPVNTTFNVPETGGTLTIPSNLCQRVAGNFAHVTTNNVVPDGTGFGWSLNHKDIVYGMLTTNGIICPTDEEYVPGTNLCVPTS